MQPPGSNGERADHRPERDDVSGDGVSGDGVSGDGASGDCASGDSLHTADANGEPSADRPRSPTVGFYHPRAGIQAGGGKSVYVRGMLRQLADDHDVVLYTGEGPLLETVAELPIDVVQVPTDRVAAAERPEPRAANAPADAAETAAETDDGSAAPIPETTTGEALETPTARFLERATEILAQSRPAGTLVPSASAQTSLLGFANARRRGLCEEMSRRLDVLYTQYFLDDVLFSRAVDVPTVYHCHGLDGRGVGEHVRSRLSATEHALANTELMADQLSRRFGVEPDGVVAPGVDIERFAPDATPAFETDAPAILFVGRVERSKGVFDLVDAVAGLSADAVCYVVGDGPHEADLRAHVAERGIEASVEFLGVVPNGELHRYYAAADVVCNPSHYESLGIANLEAMACGRPLVAARLDAIEAYVTHGESGLLVPPGDVDALRRTLDRALASPELRERLGRSAREVASEYSWDEQGRTLARLLERVAASAEREVRDETSPRSEADRGDGPDGRSRAAPRTGGRRPEQRADRLRERERDRRTTGAERARRTRGRRRGRR